MRREVSEEVSAYSALAFCRDLKYDDGAIWNDNH